MNTCPHNEEVRPHARLSRQLQRAEVRKKAKAGRRRCYLLPSRFTEESFLARLERRTLAQLGRQQSRLKRLLANAARLVSEHGGEASTVGRLVMYDTQVWARQLVLVQGVIVKRTKTPARRDARPLRLQRKFKA